MKSGTTVPRFKSNPATSTYLPWDFKQLTLLFFFFFCLENGLIILPPCKINVRIINYYRLLQVTSLEKHQ